MNIILDNGHGIDTPGKRSPDGKLLEFEFNRKIVKNILEYFKLETNFLIFNLVPEIKDISLKERCDRANELHKSHGDCLLLSIHANAGGGTGWEAFTSNGITKSDSLCKTLYELAQDTFKDLFPVRGIKTFGKEANFYILKNTNCPAILTENLFMDNDKDLKILLSKYGENLISDFHINFIKKINNLN